MQIESVLASEVVSGERAEMRTAGTLADLLQTYCANHWLPSLRPAVWLIHESQQHQGLNCRCEPDPSRLLLNVVWAKVAHSEQETEEETGSAQGRLRPQARRLLTGLPWQKPDLNAITLTRFWSP